MRAAVTGGSACRPAAGVRPRSPVRRSDGPAFRSRSRGSSASRARRQPSAKGRLPLPPPRPRAVRRGIGGRPPTRRGPPARAPGAPRAPPRWRRPDRGARRTPRPGRATRNPGAPPGGPHQRMRRGWPARVDGRWCRYCCPSARWRSAPLPRAEEPVQERASAPGSPGPGQRSAPPEIPTRTAPPRHGRSGTAGRRSRSQLPPSRGGPPARRGSPVKQQGRSSRDQRGRPRQVRAAARPRAAPRSRRSHRAALPATLTAHESARRLCPQSSCPAPSGHRPPACRRLPARDRDEPVVS